MDVISLVLEAILTLGSNIAEETSLTARTSPVLIGEPPLPRIRYYNDPDVLEAELLSHLPPGTALNTAREVMETNGFECRFTRSPFARLRPPVDESNQIRQVIYPESNLLYCNLSVIPPILSGQPMQVALTHLEGRITGIFATAGLILPQQPQPAAEIETPSN